MKQNIYPTQNRPATITGFRKLAFSIGSLLLTVTLAQAVNPLADTELAPIQLNPGDIIRTDSGDAIQGGFILKVDPQTGQETVLSQGGHLGFFGYPMGVAFDRAGQLIVANQACLLRIDPLTGAQSMIRDASGAPGGFWSLALDRNDDILVAAETAILRVDPVTGHTKIVSSGGQLNLALSLALGGKKDGEIFVTSARYAAGVGWVGAILRVNPRDGRQTIVSEAGDLGFLLGIAVKGDDIYVTGLKGHDQNFGIGQVVHVDLKTGIQRVVSQGECLVRPVGITVDEGGQLLVADPYTINPMSRDLFDGAIVRINPATGDQELIARGSGSRVNPCGVALVPAAPRGPLPQGSKQVTRSDAGQW